MPHYGKRERGASGQALESGGKTSKQEEKRGQQQQQQQQQPAQSSNPVKPDTRKQQQALMKALPLMCKLLLDISGKIRDLTGMLWHTWLLPTQSPVVQSAKQSTLNYAQRVKQHKEHMETLGESQRVPHSEGAPLHWAWEGIFEGTVEELEAQKGQAKVAVILKTVKEYKKLWQDVDEEEAHEKILICRVSKTFKSTVTKLQFASSCKDTVQMVKDVMKTLGHKVVQGRAPATAMEKLLQAALNGREEAGAAD